PEPPHLERAPTRLRRQRHSNPRVAQTSDVVERNRDCRKSTRGGSRILYSPRAKHLFRSTCYCRIEVVQVRMHSRFVLPGTNRLDSRKELHPRIARRLSSLCRYAIECREQRVAQTDGGRRTVEPLRRLQHELIIRSRELGHE